MTTYMSNWRLGDAYVNNTQDIVVAVPASHLVINGTCYDTRIEYENVHPQEDGLSFTGVMEALDKGSQEPIQRRSSRPGIPVGGIVMVVLGLALMAFGFLLNEPVAWFIYHQIHK